jgi:hypothetical protein
MIHNFNDFLNENKISSTEFIDRVKSLVDKTGISYELDSSPQQLKNGTTIIKILDKKLLEDALNEYKIKSSDILDKDKFDTVTKLYLYEIDDIEVMRKMKSGAASTYHFFSRGAIRPARSLSGGDARKFDSYSDESISTVIDWMIEDYKDIYIERIVKYLNPDNFGKFKRGYSLDIEKVEAYMPELTVKVLTRLRDEEPEIFEAISPEIMCLSYLAHYREGEIWMDGGDKMHNNFILKKCKISPAESRYPGDGESFFMMKTWKTSTKFKIVSFQLDTTWRIPDNFAAYLPSKSVTDLMKKTDVPDYMLLVMKELQKKPNYDFEAIDKKYAGAKAGHQYGI